MFKNLLLINTRINVLKSDRICPPQNGQYEKKGWLSAFYSNLLGCSLKFYNKLFFQIFFYLPINIPENLVDLFVY